MRNEMVAVLTLLFTLTFLSGCPAVSGKPGQAHVEAERARLEAIGPEYRDMANNAYRKTEDGDFEKWFDEDQAKRRNRTVDTWERDVEAAEKELGTNQPENK
jgi:hypothetical protein